MDPVTVIIVKPNTELQQAILQEIEELLPPPEYTDQDRADFYAYVATDTAPLPPDLSNRLAGMATMMGFYSIMEKVEVLQAS